MERYDEELERYRQNITRRRGDRRGKTGRRRLDYQPPEMFPPDVLIMGGVLAVVAFIFALLIGE